MGAYQHVLDLSLRRSVSGWQKLKHSSGPRTVSVHAQLAGGCVSFFCIGREQVRKKICSGQVRQSAGVISIDISASCAGGLGGGASEDRSGG